MPAQLVDAVGAVLLVGVDDDLRVRLRAEAVAARLELARSSR